MLEFIYTARVSLTSMDLAVEIGIAAYYLKITELIHIIKEHVCGTVNNENVFYWFMISEYRVTSQPLYRLLLGEINFFFPFSLGGL